MSQSAHWVSHAQYEKLCEKICCQPLAECRSNTFKGDKYAINLNGLPYLVIGRVHSAIEDACLFITPLLPKPSDQNDTKDVLFNGKLWIQGKSEVIKPYIPETAKLVNQQEAESYISALQHGYTLRSEPPVWEIVDGILIRTITSPASKMPLYELFYRNIGGQVQALRIREPHTTISELIEKEPSLLRGEEEQLMLI